MRTEPPDLTAHLGKTIDKFCTRSIVTNKDASHCAHFVSHMMEYESFPHTCRNQSSADKVIPGLGAAIRVNELFNGAREVGHWSERPLGLVSCLIFVTISSNMRECGNVLAMDNNRLKHVGIYQNGVVWHYGLSRVEKDQEKPFITKFTHRYIVAGNTVKFFYARFLK